MTPGTASQKDPLPQFPIWLPLSATPSSFSKVIVATVPDLCQLGCDSDSNAELIAHPAA